MVVLVTACGPSVDEQDSASDGEVDDDGHDSGSGTGLTHGVVGLELQRGESQETNPYVGTAVVVATLDYRECLVDFYKANPGLRQDGVEGSTVFGTLDGGGEGWMDRLCDDTREHVDCEVAWISQHLDAMVMTGMTVTFDVSGELEGGRLWVGPLPTSETAQCAGGSAAVVGLSSVAGRDSNGEELWRLEAFSPSEAVTDQGAPITVYAAPL
jgi:hypothetical protein